MEDEGRHREMIREDVGKSVRGRRRVSLRIVRLGAFASMVQDISLMFLVRVESTNCSFGTTTEPQPWREFVAGVLRFQPQPNVIGNLELSTSIQAARTALTLPTTAHKHRNTNPSQNSPQQIVKMFGFVRAKPTQFLLLQLP